MPHFSCQTSLMRNLSATLCLTLAVLLGSATMLVAPNTAEAGLVSAILRAILGESDKVAKGIGKSTDGLPTGGSKITDGAGSKIEGENYSHTADRFGSRIPTDLYSTKNRCRSNRWAISVFQDTNIYSEPKISSTITGTLDKDEKVCVVKEEGEWVKTFYGWVEKQSVTWVSDFQKGATAYQSGDYASAE